MAVGKGQSPPKSFRKGRGWVSVAAVVVGWWVIVAISAGSRPPDTSWVGLPDLGTAVSFLMLAAVVVGLVTLFQLRPSGHASDEQAGGMRTIMTIGLMALVAFTLMGDRELPLPEMFEESVVGEVPERPVLGEGNRLPESTVVVDETDFLIGVGMMISTGLLAWILLRRRRVEAGPVDDKSAVVGDEGNEGFVEELSAAADVAHRRADSILDPRQAVLAAYSNLEEVMDQHGHSRYQQETANEHLNRVLGAVPVDRAPLIRLAGLYELARFSSRPVTVEDRGNALADLASARDELGELVRVEVDL